MTESFKFLLLACDGFWAAFSPEDAVATAASLLAEFGTGGREPSAADHNVNPRLSVAKQVTNRLLNVAVRQRHAQDNVTVLLVLFEFSPMDHVI